MKTNLKEMNIKKNICGWYDIKEMRKILSSSIKITNKAEEEKKFAISEFGIPEVEEDLNIFIIYKDKICQNMAEIKVNNHTLAYGESDILSEAIATAIMHYYGYRGNYSLNQIQKIIEIMENSNRELNQYYMEHD